MDPMCRSLMLLFILFPSGYEEEEKGSEEERDRTGERGDVMRIFANIVDAG